MEPTGQIFSTRDLYFAATLLTMKHKLVGIDYQIEGMHHNAVGYFNFEDTTDLHDAEKKYWSDELLIEPKKYTTAMRLLKSQVNNNYKNPNIDMVNSQIA